MITEATLLPDQVFQLNTFIWALQDLPEAGAIRPVLRDAGYDLRAIGRRVIVPDHDSVLVALENLIGSADRSPCHPDLWLKHSDHPVQPVVELKARGFSSASSNRRQALKLMVAAFDLADSLGESVECPGHVVYATVRTDTDDLAATLIELADALKTEGAKAASTGVIGLSVGTEGVTLSSPTPSDLPEPAAEALATAAIVLTRDGENHLSPLYFVPWIPGIKDSQNQRLHDEGLRELTARVLTHALGRIGRAQVPTTLSMTGDQLLRGATFGIFDRWRDSDRDQFSKAAIDIVEKALESHVGVHRTAKPRLEIELLDLEQQSKAIRLLEKTDPTDQRANLATALQEQLELFDNLGDTGSNS